MMGIIGKACLRFVCGIFVFGGLIYVNYRMEGGPPLRKVYKEVRDKRIQQEIEKAKKEGRIVYLNDYEVV